MVAPLRAQQPIEPGGESEATEYADDFGGLWYFTPGALAWLREVRGEVGGRGPTKKK